MNWKQRIVQKHIENEFETGSVVITEDGPESLRAADRYGDSLVFWLDDETGLVYDEAHFPEFYASWREKATKSGATSGVESTPETAPAVAYAPEDYDPCTEIADPFTYGPGFDNGSFVLCPDCGAMVRSGYGAFVSEAAADQYAREHCPKCAAAAKVARAAHLAEHERFWRERKRFLKDLETVVKKAQPAVQRLAFEDLGGPQEAVLILYKDRGIKVWTASSSPLYIAKSVMEALPD